MRRAATLVLGTILALASALALIGLLHRPAPGPLRLSRETVEVDGSLVSYHQSGGGADVVLLHGGMGSAEDFTPVLELLAREFRVTAVDRPGFGLSQAAGDLATYPGNAGQVAGLIRRLGLVRPVLVGHSHGGGVALQLAEDDPELPGALVLLASAWKPGDPPALLDRIGALPLIGEGIAATVGRWVAPSMIASTLKEMLGPDATRVPADFVAYRQQLWSNPRSLTVRSRQQVTDGEGLSAIASRLDRVRVPALVLGCDGDPYEGGALDSRGLARELPAAQVRWLAGCGHYVQYGQPDEVVGAIREAARLASRN